MNATTTTTYKCKTSTNIIYKYKRNEKSLRHKRTWFGAIFIKWKTRRKSIVLSRRHFPGNTWLIGNQAYTRHPKKRGKLLFFSFLSGERVREGGGRGVFTLLKGGSKERHFFYKKKRKGFWWVDSEYWKRWKELR